jgi:sulfur relay (sulfurtransferase) DsrF/TusC family protein
MSKTIVVEIGRPPFGHENTFAGLYVGLGSLSKAMDVIVVLRGDGVYTGRKGQVEPMENINLPGTEEQITDIIDLDGRVIAEKGALEERGIAPEELIDEVEILESAAIHDLILAEGDHIVPF